MTTSARTHDARPRRSEQLLAFAGWTAQAARWSATRAAEGVEATRAPVATLAQAVRRLSGLSAHYAERLLEQNASMAQRALADGARRLRQLAKAPDLVSAYQEQRRSLPALRDRVGAELRATLGIVGDGSRELSGLALETYEQLSQPRKAAGKPRTTARRSARRAPKKAATRKTRSSA